MEIVAYIFHTEIDGKSFEFKVKPPTVESYNNLTYKTSYEKQLAYFYDCIVEPDRGNLERIVEEYPGIVDAFAANALKKLEKEYKGLIKGVEKQFKQYETKLGNSALALLEFLGKPMNDNNMAIALLLVDGLHCLRHLRKAHSKDK